MNHHKIQQIYKNLLILLGIAIFLTFIWLRFIRKRLPKDIPFQFTIIGFSLIVFLCLMYSFLTYSLLRKNKTNSFSNIIKEISTLIFMPLELLDDFLKNKLDANNILKIIIPILDYTIIKTNIYYYSLIILPRLVLLSVLMVDTFIFNKLFFIYKALFLGIFLLSNVYIIYSLRKTKTNLIILFETYLSQGHINIPYVYELYELLRVDAEKNDDEYDDEDWDHTQPTINIKPDMFVEYQLTISEKLSYNLASSNKCRNIIAEKENITLEELNKKYFKYIDKVLNFLIENLERILQIAYILQKYEVTHNMQKIKNIKLLIYTNYLLCWLYILIVSIHTLNIYDIIIMLIRTFLSIPEPFSDIILWY